MRTVTVAEMIVRLQAHRHDLPVLIAPSVYEIPAEATRVVYVPANAAVGVGPAVVILPAGRSEPVRRS
jgi:hypothetical protein